MPKNIGGMLVSKLKDTRLAFFHYLKMTWGEPTGIKRWTTYDPWPRVVDRRNIKGTVEDWDPNRIFTPMGLQESEQTALSISDITFGNADYTFSDLMVLSEGGVVGVPVTLWTAFFDKDDLTVMDSKFVRFVGEFDRAEATAGKSPIVRVSLLAGKHPMRLIFPRRRFNAAHGFNWIPPPNLKITWGSGQYSAPAPSNSQTGSGGGGGGGTEPPPPNVGPHPRMPPVRVDRPRSEPQTPPRAGGRDTTTVTR